MELLIKTQKIDSTKYKTKEYFFSSIKHNSKLVRNQNQAQLNPMGNCYRFKH